MAEQRSFGGESPPSDAEAILGNEAPDYLVRTILFLSWIRSVGVVQRALAERFPTEESWQRMMTDAGFHQAIANYQQVVNDVRSLAVLGGEVPDLERLQEAGGQRYELALDALSTAAERLGTPVADLLVVLIHA